MQEADCVACDTGMAQNMTAKEDDGAAFKAMREQLKQGVQVVSAPQLFPTPPELARRMVELAEIEPGQAVLEPSAGTGNILRAIREVTYQWFGSMPIRTAVEINTRLCDRLRISEAGATIHARDFLQCHGDIGTFHKILMNPPFGGGQDIEHIKHAMGMLKPGGRLVAICADGPRQNDTLKPIVDAMGGTWEKLPQGTFKDSGTNVNTVLLTLQTREQTE
jgi:protein-L-isoaspartate O-methyltransferase